MCEAIIPMYMEFQPHQSNSSKKDIALFHFIRLIVTHYGSNAGVGVFLHEGMPIIVSAFHLLDCILAVMNDRILDE